MTEFEKYLQRHKKEMDVEHVDPEIWTQIEGQLPKAMKTSLWRKRTIQFCAAAAIFFLGFFSYQSFFNTEKPQLPSTLLAEYGFENQNFSNLIDDKLAQIRRTPVSKDYKTDLQLLLDQSKYLDQHYQQSLERFAAGADDKFIVLEVLKYYQSKEMLLDKIIYEIEKINKNEKRFNINSEKSNLSI